ASSAEASEPDRRTAGLLGIAFGIYGVYSAGFFAATAMLQPARLADPLFVLRGIPTVAAGIFVVSMTPRLAAPLRAGRTVLAGAAVISGLGAIGGVLVAFPGFLPVRSGYEGTDLLVRLLFGATVILAVARYGLAAAGSRERSRARAGLRLLLAAAL